MRRNQSGFIPLLPILIAVVVGALIGVSAAHIAKHHKLPISPISAKKLPAVQAQDITKATGVDVTKPLAKPPAAKSTGSSTTTLTAIGTVRTFISLVKQGNYSAADYYVTTPFMFGVARLTGNQDATNADLVSACNSSFVCPILINSMSIGDNYTSSPYTGTHNEKGVTLTSQLSNVNQLASTVTGNKPVTVSLINVSGTWLIDNASINGDSLY